MTHGCCLPGEDIVLGITTGRRASGGNVKAVNLDVTLTSIKHCCRQCWLFHGNDSPWWLWPLSAALTTKQNSSGMVWGAKLVSGAALASKFPRSQAILYWLCWSFRWKYHSVPFVEPPGGFTSYECNPLTNAPAELFHWPFQMHQFKPRSGDELFHQRGRWFLTKHHDSDSQHGLLKVKRKRHF